MKKIIMLFCFLTVSNFVLGQNIVINEILTSNTYINADEDGNYNDWIELYNKGTGYVNLVGFGLTDDDTILYKWVFPSVIMAPGEYLLVWASGKNRAVVGQPLHTNFKISASGESISLTNPIGTILNTIPATLVPSDISYGRFPNGTGPFVFFQTPTPNEINATAGYSEFLNPPIFSQAGGFFTSNFALTLSSTTPGTTILYTLDGSDPDENNLGGTTYNYKNQYPESPGQTPGDLLQKSFQTNQYTAPITIQDQTAMPNKIANISTTYNFFPFYIPVNPIFKGMVVRAKAIKPGALSSKIATQSYFISPLGSGRFTLPVVSLSISENKLFEYNNGISVAGVDFDNWRQANPNEVINYNENANYIRSGFANEKVGTLNYFVNGTEVVNQDVGIRIHGGTTRAFQNKALTLYARSEYGADFMNYRFFSDITDTDFSRIILRNSGGDFQNTLFRDALNQELVKSLHVETSDYQPSITFINGEYWGILNLREKYDNDYFKRVYNFGANELDFLENEGFAMEGDNLDYLDLINYFENNSLGSDANYSYIKTRLDPENFIDYFTTNIFFQNSDWPGNNIQFWRKKTSGYIPNAAYGHDGRWRWAFHDMDDTFSFGTDDFNHNNLADATAVNGPAWPNPEWSTLILRKLLENSSFKIDFISRFADLLNTNFLSSRITSKIDEMKSVLLPEINEQIARWKAPTSLQDWDYYIAYETDFANSRPTLQRDHIRAQFGIPENVNATLDVSSYTHGIIKINTIDIADGTPGISGNPYPWTGIYFKDIPVKLKAIAKPGFVFSYWSGSYSSTNAEITVIPSGSFSVIAHFVLDPTYEPSVPIYFWLMDGNIANNVPLENLNSTYELTSNATIDYQSCLSGYPFAIGNINRNKASMERRNYPTPINYRPEANNSVAYDANAMKGLEIKQPFQSGGLENIMVFRISSLGFKNIKFSFAAVDELAGVTGIVVDYAVNSGTPVWTNAGLTNSALTLLGNYELFQLDFSSILPVNNNADFKIRFRFTGPNLTLDAGNRVTFNNIAVEGVQLPLAIAQNNGQSFNFYPNPFSDNITIDGIDGNANYKIFSVDGKLVKKGTVENKQIYLAELSKGMYLLQLDLSGKIMTKKIVKKN